VEFRRWVCCELSSEELNLNAEDLRSEKEKGLSESGPWMFKIQRFLIMHTIITALLEVVELSGNLVFQALRR